MMPSITWGPIRVGLWLVVLMMLAAACSATAEQVIPTSVPTATPSHTPTATDTPDRNATATYTPTRLMPTGGPSPTSLLGPSRTPPPNITPTSTRVLHPNAPRIEFFTSDVLSVGPGGTVTLYWSVRGSDSAVIYLLNNNGERSRVWNVGPDGQQTVSTRSTDRGQLDFVLNTGEGDFFIEARLTIPIQCPIEWFFSPSPDDCPNAEAQETTLIEQPFERGVMLYVEETNRVYALFNDGGQPAWLSRENVYDPEIHPEADSNFPQGTGLFQPLRELGLVWRTEESVRIRLGLGIQESSLYVGFIQTTPGTNTTDNLYVQRSNGDILHLIPGGELWQVLSLVP